jgi:hypothetical protein
VETESETAAGTVSAFFFGLVVFAIVSLVAGSTVFGRFADDFLRREFFTIGGAGERRDRIPLEDARIMRDILRSDLEVVEKEAGAVRIELRGSKGVEDLGEGDLDGAAVLQYR